MDNRKIILTSFRRSGTHLLLETIKRNFDCDIINDVFHPNFDLHCSIILRTTFNVIYVYRDVRDVMRSLYNFFLFSDWRIWSGFDADFSGVDFSGFLNGKVKIINAHCPHFKMVLTDPITAWVESTNWLEPLNKHDVKGSPFSVKYEDLVYNFNEEIYNISAYLNLKFKNNRPIQIKEPVAQTPQRIEVEYSDEDSQMLWAKAGQRLIDLGY